MEMTDDEIFEYMHKILLKKIEIKTEPEIKKCECKNVVFHEGEYTCVDCSIIQPYICNKANDNCGYSFYKRTVYDPQNRFQELVDSYFQATDNVSDKIVNEFIESKQEKNYANCRTFLNKNYKHLNKYVFELVFKCNGLEKLKISHEKKMDITEDFKKMSEYFKLHFFKKSTINLYYALSRILTKNSIVFPILTIQIPQKSRRYDVVFRQWLFTLK